MGGGIERYSGIKRLRYQRHEHETQQSAVFAYLLIIFLVSEFILLSINGRKGKKTNQKNAYHSFKLALFSTKSHTPEFKIHQNREKQDLLTLSELDPVTFLF